MTSATACLVCPPVDNATGLVSVPDELLMILMLVALGGVVVASAVPLWTDGDGQRDTGARVDLIVVAALVGVLGTLLML